jgi:hypothetical protein
VNVDAPVEGGRAWLGVLRLPAIVFTVERDLTVADVPRSDAI